MIFNIIWNVADELNMHRFFVLLLYLCSFYPLLSHENTNFIRFKNFTAEDKGFGSFHELKLWANYQMMEILPDDNSYGLSDGICQFVPNTGLEFFLTADSEKKRPVQLYLDIAIFRITNPGMKFPPHKLKIYINRKLKKTVEFGKMITSPVQVSIDPSELEHDKINVFLEPDVTKGKFWCIWDAFYSYEKL